MAMYISTRSSTAVISGVKLKPGRHKYNLDHKDPLTAFQLASLKELGIVDFDETIPKELIEKTAEALNAGTLEVNSILKSVKRRKIGLGIKKEVEYLGSKLPEHGHAGKPDKEPGGVGEDGDRDSGEGGVSGQKKDAGKKRR